MATAVGERSTPTTKPGGTHQLTGNQRDVAHTAAQVEHPHAFFDARRPQQILGQVAEKRPCLSRR